MAKKQTFTDKLAKDSKKFKFVKYIQTFSSEETGGVKFLSRMLRLEENENIDQALKREEESSNISSFAEDFTEHNEETPAEETPAEETQEEAPAEELSTEEPVEESQEETPADETPAEDTQEEAPVEETPTEEPAEEVSKEESAPEEDSAEEAEESSKE